MPLKMATEIDSVHMLLVCSYGRCMIKGSWSSTSQLQREAEAKHVQQGRSLCKHPQNAIMGRWEV